MKRSDLSARTQHGEVPDWLARLELNERQIRKLRRVAELRRQSLQEAAVQTFGNLLKVVPASIKPRNIVTDAPVKSIGMEGGLARIELKNGRVFYNFPSRQRYTNLYYTFHDLLPKEVTAETYGPYHDVSFRYLRATEVPFFPDHEGVTVIEGGAYVGLKAIGYYDGLKEGGKVIAVEIGRAPYELLCKNIEANALEGKVIPVHCGIYKDVGEMEAKYEIYASHSLTPPDEHNQYTRRETVRTDTLDNIIDAHNLETVDYINLQLNGAEGAAIDGLRRNLDKVKIIYIGAHYHVNGQPQDEIIVKQLIERGCRILHKRGGGITAVTPKWLHEYENDPRRNHPD